MFKSSGTIDPNIEKRIITSLIASDKIASELVPITHRELFRLDIAKTIYTWIQEFHKVYGKAPGIHIRDIFTTHKASLNATERLEIEEFLSTLSKEFANAEWSNEDYLLSTGKKYLQKRHLVYMSEQIQFYAESDLIEEAEACIKTYGSMINSGLSNWVKPFDDKKFIRKVFDRKEAEPLFTMGGALDHLFGPLRKAWLMLLLGPMKRGKTWGLQEVAQCALVHGKRVAFFSLEMEDTDISGRFYQGFASAPEQDEDIQYPIFDCVLNQTNSCNDKRRVNKIPRPEIYTPKSKYKTCTLCRTTDPKSFKPSVWYFTEHRKALNYKTTVQTIDGLNTQIQSNLFRLISYEIGSANVQTIERDLRMLELSEGWIPDVIIIDYADILKPEENGLTGRDKENAAWKALKALAQRRKAFVATGSQGNRDSFAVESLDEKNTSEDIRKLAHIDIAATINQTQQEKLIGYSRIGILNHRWKEFHKSLFAIVLQQFKAGQFNLDSTLYVDTERQEKAKKLKRS